MRPPQSNFRSREPSRACDPHRFPCTQRLLTTDKLPLQGRTGRQSNRGLRNERHGKFPISRRQCHVGMCCELTSSAGPRRCSTYRRAHGRTHARPPHTRAVAPTSIPRHTYPRNLSGIRKRKDRRGWRPRRSFR